MAKITGIDFDDQRRFKIQKDEKRKLYRVKFSVDTIIFVDPSIIDDDYNIMDAIQDSLSADCIGASGSLDVKEIDIAKKLRPQFSPAFIDPDLMPENGGPTIKEIAKNVGVDELGITYRPTERN